MLSSKILHFFIGFCACLAFILFTYGISFPVFERVRGDAFQYISIANGFSSFSHAVSYIGERTYGYPLFLYVVKTVFSVTNLPQWSTITSYVQFLFHVCVCFAFYEFFLKPQFQRAHLSATIAQIVMTLLIVYPPFVMYTTIPLTDTFCVDLLLIAVTLNFVCVDLKNKYLSTILAIFCGLILGFAILTRVSFWPAITVFYLASFFESIKLFRVDRSSIFKVSMMAIGTLMLILPVVTNFKKSYGTIGLETLSQSGARESLQAGLSAIRVYWSGKYVSHLRVPGVRDSFLDSTYANCHADSVKSVAFCLLSKPIGLPFYFGKKIIALFDVPHLQPYAVDLTPAWFAVLERSFAIIAFCGFISLIFLTPLRLFLNHNHAWIGFPWAIFVLSFIGMQSLFHVEGRYGFPIVSLSIVSLFFGFAQARQLGNKFFVTWCTIIMISGVVFIYQLHQWDMTIPV